MGYWLGEADDPDAHAVICPLLFFPNIKGLSKEKGGLFYMNHVEFFFH